MGSTLHIGHQELRNESGVSLLEALIGVALIASTAFVFSTFLPKSTQVLSRIQARNFASSNLTSTLAELKQKSYPLIPLTPEGSYFPVSGSATPSACDCNTAHFDQLPNQSVITNGKVTYTQSVCTNLLVHSGAGFYSVCPTQSDTGLKNLVVHLSWKVGQASQTLTMSSMISQMSAVAPPNPVGGSVVVTLCRAVGRDVCDPYGPNTIDLVNAEVAVYKPGVLADDQGVLPLPTIATLQLPDGTGYTLHVQKTGYFPYYATVDVHAGQTTAVTAYMRQISAFSSKVTGEAFVADHPVITKVMAQYKDSTNPLCQDPMELLELYNPTQSTYTFGGASGPNPSRLAYCNETVCTAYTLGEPSLFTKNTTYSLLPGSFLLIAGGATAGVTPWGKTPDISYKTSDFPGTEGLISYNTGEGIQLQVSNGSSYQVVDAVSWMGDDHAAPVWTPYWKGTLQQNLLDPAQTQLAGVPPVCSVTNPNFGVLLRANRRGETRGNGQFVDSVNGPGDTNGSLQWGAAYDGGSFGANFGSLEYDVTLSSPPLHSSINANFSSRTGTPSSGIVAEILDPTSPFQNPVVMLYGSGDPHYTAQLQINQVSGQSSGDGAASSWPMTIVSGASAFSSGSGVANVVFTSPLLPPTTTQWVVLTSSYPIAPRGAPQPCGNGGFLCDTDQQTTQLPPAVSYGVNPDSITPYAVLDRPAQWGIVTGQVLEQGTNQPLAGIPIAVSDAQGRFPTFEKVTAADGTYSILLPVSGGPFSFTFNDSNPVTIVPQINHYFDPHHAMDSTTLASQTIVFTTSGQTVSLATIMLSPTVPTALGNLSISGAVVSSSTLPVPMPNQPVELRNSQGYIIAVTSTDALGLYTFPGLANDSYFVDVVADRLESPLPNRRSIVLSGSNVSGQDFGLLGAQATVIIQTPTGNPHPYSPGSLVLMGPSWVNLAPGTQPLMVDHTAANTEPIYSATLDANNTATFHVSAGLITGFDCWGLQPNGKYFYEGHADVVASVPLAPLQTYIAQCPAN